MLHDLLQYVRPEREPEETRTIAAIGTGIFGILIVFGLVLSFSGMVFAVDPPTATNTLVKKDGTIL